MQFAVISSVFNEKSTLSHPYRSEFSFWTWEDAASNQSVSVCLCVCVGGAFFLSPTSENFLSFPLKIFFPKNQCYPGSFQKI